MEIRQLITFKKVVELGSLTKAAHYLGYTQSTVTTHIQELEKSIDAKLFDRMGRKNIITESGEQLMEYTKELMITIDKINSISVNGEVKGEIKIGAPESITVYMLQSILKEYREKFPNVKISIINGNCNYLKMLLFKGEIDITFLMMEDFKDVNLVVNKIKEEKLVIIANNEFDFKNLDFTQKNNKIDQCIIYNEKDCSYRIAFETYLDSQKIIANNTMELWSIESIKQCVKTGLGISILPEITVKEDIEKGNLQGIEFESIDRKICSLLVYHKNKWLSKSLIEFINICKKIN
ncbi:LysR family transcriptional regulator [Paraclostridium ghonii]|uniref:LysR family transcriptional regulator n=1 Tax=Paraclostridium ghonii TaxID=29358 RepID=UPI00202CF687|nr:LysR family transcriptional regulator [Paeniclostridium ghonii]MCM0166223.1 LysR family transcriptional regulator [Paeniclostridium ghonii]